MSSYYNAQTFFILAVNVDDAVDDIVRQFKGVSDGFIQKVVGSSSPSTEGSSTSTSRNMSWNVDEMDKSISRQNTLECVLSSDNEEGDENIDKEVAEDNEWNSDNELSSKDYSQHLINHGSESSNLDLDRKHDATVEAKVGKDVPATNFNLVPDNLEDVPPEVYSQLGLLSFLLCTTHLLIVIFGLFFVTY